MKERVWRNPVDRRPLAEQIFDILVRDIRNGSIPVGSAIPSVRSISASVWVALTKIASNWLGAR